MNITRMIVLGLALLAGAAAFFLMMGNKVESPVQVVQPIQEKTVRVLVSDLDLQRGNRLTVEGVRWVDWPEKALSPYYILEGTVELEELTQAVARTSIVQGEPIIENKIVRAGSSGMMAAVLEAGMRAITTRVSPETASGGFILPGDRVDVYYTEADSQSDGTKFMLLLENVKVLAIDAFYTETSEVPHIAGATATLELSPSDAEYFTTARNSKGQIALALRSVFEPEGEVESKQRTDVQVIRYGRS